MRRLLPPAVVLFLLAGCAGVPAETEKARGVLTGVNLVLALSVLVFVVAVGAIALVMIVDRAHRSRAALAEGGPSAEEEEPEDEVVAGITVGRAPVPRWLYGAYVLIPLFAFSYILSNIAPADTGDAAATPEPVLPCTDDCEIAAEAIEFTKDEITVVAEADITVTFDNTDAVVHDFTVWENATSGTGEQAATTGTVNAGGNGTAEFTAPAMGEEWSYNCTIHPAMTGAIVPAEPAA